MVTAAKTNFDSHILQCEEATKVYEYLQKSGYSAEFGLRYIWVASISALDHYISELVVERSTQQLSENVSLAPKLMNEMLSVAMLLDLHQTPTPQFIVEFRKFVSQIVRIQTFQKSSDVANGLSYIWSEKNKWPKIAKQFGAKADAIKYKLNSIAARRDIIVHSADYDGSSGKLNECKLEDAVLAYEFIAKLVLTIDNILVED